MAWSGKKMIGMPFLKKCQKLFGICTSTSGDNDVINHYTFLSDLKNNFYVWKVRPLFLF